MHRHENQITPVPLPPLNAGASDILHPYLSLVRLAVFVSCIIPFVVFADNLGRTSAGVESATWGALWIKLVTLVIFAGLACVAAWRLPKRWATAIGNLSTGQSDSLRSLSPGRADWAILLSAGVSLLLELSVIRWQG